MSNERVNRKVGDSMAELKRTPLYEHYIDSNLKMVGFGGWELPIQFTGIIEEHEAVRNQAGLFDVSHMGEIMIEGENAEVFLNHLLTNNVEKVEIHQAQYNALCYPSGGTIDDLIIYKLAETQFLLTPNASNKEKVLDWLKEHHQEGVQITDLSDQTGLLALQGPKAKAILSQLTDADLDSIASYHFKPDVTVAGIPHVLVSRTGYTGEDGFELYIPTDKTEYLWNELLTAGSEAGLKPCGLGARDTLRLEAGLALYGHELSETISPLEGGIGFAVKTKKTQPFIGQEILTNQRSKGLERRVRGLELIDKGIARENYPVFSEAGDEIGYVTSGTKSPTLNKSIAFALLQMPYTELDTIVYIAVRKKKIAAKVTATPFYKRK